MNVVRLPVRRSSGRIDWARLYLGLLLAAMAFGQALSWDVFVDAVTGYDVGLPAPAVAAALLAGEGVGAVLVLSRRARWSRIGAYVALAVTVVWSMLAVQAFARGLVLDNCGCFGAYFSQALRWWVLLEDAAFVALAAVVLRSVWPQPGAPAALGRLAPERSAARD